MVQATGLATPPEQLTESRKSFITSIKNRAEFDADCSVIIPELQRQWKLAAAKQPNMNDDMPNFQHYLFNYSPQLLQLAIRRMEAVTTDISHPVTYYKTVVQQLRRNQIKRTEAKAKAAEVDPMKELETILKGMEGRYALLFKNAKEAGNVIFPDDLRVRNLRAERLEVVLQSILALAASKQIVAASGDYFESAGARAVMDDARRVLAIKYDNNDAQHTLAEKSSKLKELVKKYSVKCDAGFLAEVLRLTVK